MSFESPSISFSWRRAQLCRDSSVTGVGSDDKVVSELGLIDMVGVPSDDMTTSGFGVDDTTVWGFRMDGMMVLLRSEGAS